MSTSSSPPGESATTPTARGAQARHSNSISEALGDLIQAARSRGRDMKLVSALLRSMADFMLEHGADAAITTSTDTDDESAGRHEEASNAAAAGHPRASISPALRSRLHAVIDSLSDDETARVLGTGTRQVRRRALAGGLYFFQAGRKRRYPCWQFIGGEHALPGLQFLTPGIPRDWPPEAVHAFMAAKHPRLLLQGAPSSPVEWLARGGEPSTVRRLLDAEHGNEPNKDRTGRDPGLSV